MKLDFIWLDASTINSFKEFLILTPSCFTEIEWLGLRLRDVQTSEMDFFLKHTKQINETKLDMV